jgi:hypothetical protein
MNAGVSSGQSHQRSGVAKLVLKTLSQLVILGLTLAALVFVPAGSNHLDWGMAWALLGVYSTALFVTFILLALRDPDLAKERAGIAEGAKSWDIKLVNLFNVLAYLVCWPEMNIRSELSLDGWRIARE